jgi:hypothetical protein
MRGKFNQACIPHSVRKIHALVKITRLGYRALSLGCSMGVLVGLEAVSALVLTTVGIPIMAEGPRRIVREISSVFGYS